MKGKPQENPSIVSQDEFTLGQGEGISQIATKLGIRESYLDAMNGFNSMNIRGLDRFLISKDTYGSAELIQFRGNKVINKYQLHKEAVYQDIEKGPPSFPNINFIRIPLNDEYQLIGRSGESLGEEGPLRVSTKNLDLLKKEIEKVSGVFIRECSSRSAQFALSCSIGKIENSSNILELKSNSWYTIFSSRVGLDGIQRLLKGRPEALGIAKSLATALQL